MNMTQKEQTMPLDLNSLRQAYRKRGKACMRFCLLCSPVPLGRCTLVVRRLQVEERLASRSLVFLAL